MKIKVTQQVGKDYYEKDNVFSDEVTLTAKEVVVIATRFGKSISYNQALDYIKSLESCRKENLGFNMYYYCADLEEGLSGLEGLKPEDISLIDMYREARRYYYKYAHKFL